MSIIVRGVVAVHRFLWRHWALSPLVAVVVAAIPSPLVPSPLTRAVAALFAVLATYVWVTGAAAAVRRWSRRNPPPGRKQLSPTARLIRSRLTVVLYVSSAATAWVFLVGGPLGAGSELRRDAELFLAGVLGVSAVAAMMVLYSALAPSKSRSRGAGSHVNADGSPKIGYLSAADAQRTADRQGAQEGRTLNVYRCADPSCRKFHVGHQK